MSLFLWISLIYLILAGVFFGLDSYFRIPIEYHDLPKTDTLYALQPITVIKFLKDPLTLSEEVSSYLQQNYPVFEVLFILNKNTVFYENHLHSIGVKSYFLKTSSEKIDKKQVLEILKMASYDFILVDHHSTYVKVHFLKKMMDRFDHGWGCLNTELTPKHFSLLCRMFYYYQKTIISPFFSFQVLFKRSLVERSGGVFSLAILLSERSFSREFLLRNHIKVISLPRDFSQHHSHRNLRMFFKYFLENEKKAQNKNLFFSLTKQVFHPIQLMLFFGFFTYPFLTLQGVYSLSAFLVSIFLLTGFVYRLHFRMRRIPMKYLHSIFFVGCDLMFFIYFWPMLLIERVLKPMKEWLFPIQSHQKTLHKQSHPF